MGQSTLGVIKMSRYRTTMAEVLQKVYETPQGYALVQKAKEIAKKMAGSYTNAVKEIEKLQKGLSNNSAVKDALLKANESLEEGKMKDIFTADQEGKSAAEIAKIMKLPLSTVKKILGESTEELQEFTNKMIQDLKKAYSTLPARISTDQANALSRHLDRLDLVSLKKLTKEKIPFVTTLARNKIYKKTGKFEEFLNEDDIPAIDKDNAPGVKIAKIRAIDKKDDKEKDKSKESIEALKDQIAMLKVKLENEKNKAIKPEPNPDTGEVPLTIGLAHKLLRDKEKKEEVKETTKDDKSFKRHMDFLNKQKKDFEKKEKERKAKEKSKKEDVQEAFAVQITKKDGSKLIHGKFHMKSKADEFIKWYKTGDMKDVKDIKIVLEDIQEADLSKPQIKKVHKMADELPKKDFKDRYGKEKGDAVRYATATNIVKKKLGIEESAAAREIDRTNTRRDSMDYQMYKKSAELLRKKDYKSLGQHINKSETAPKEYVMGVIAKKEPQTFTKLYGKQTGYYSLMKPLKMSENKEADMMFKKLSQRAQTYVNELLRSGMGTMEAIQKAKDKFKESNMKNEEMRLRVETMAALKKKADKSGMPYSILKKVFDRGMAAWKGGHRPGASQHQWAYARVNSFTTKSSGTWGGADKDLAAKVRGSK